jgi:hypothetical protein
VGGDSEGGVASVAAEAAGAFWAAGAGFADRGAFPAKVGRTRAHDSSCGGTTVGMLLAAPGGAPCGVLLRSASREAEDEADEEDDEEDEAAPVPEGSDAVAEEVVTSVSFGLAITDGATRAPPPSPPWSLTEPLAVVTSVSCGKAITDGATRGFFAAGSCVGVLSKGTLRFFS